MPTMPSPLISLPSEVWHALQHDQIRRRGACCKCPTGEHCSRSAASPRSSSLRQARVRSAPAAAYRSRHGSRNARCGGCATRRRAQWPGSPGSLSPRRRHGGPRCPRSLSLLHVKTADARIVARGSGGDAPADRGRAIGSTADAAHAGPSLRTPDPPELRRFPLPSRGPRSACAAPPAPTPTGSRRFRDRPPDAAWDAATRRRSGACLDGGFPGSAANGRYRSHAAGDDRQALATPFVVQLRARFRRTAGGSSPEASASSRASAAVTRVA